MREFALDSQIVHLCKFRFDVRVEDCEEAGIRKRSTEGVRPEYRAVDEQRRIESVRRFGDGQITRRANGENSRAGCVRKTIEDAVAGSYDGLGRQLIGDSQTGRKAFIVR